MNPQLLGKIVYAIGRDPALADNPYVRQLAKHLDTVKDSSKLSLNDGGGQDDNFWRQSSTRWQNRYADTKAEYDAFCSEHYAELRRKENYIGKLKAQIRNLKCATVIADARVISDLTIALRAKDNEVVALASELAEIRNAVSVLTRQTTK